MTRERTWAALVPELEVGDIAASRAFYVDVLGFAIAFERPEDRFLYLEYGPAQLMLVEGGAWRTGPLERPYGRGVNFQIETPSLAAIVHALAVAGHPLFRDAQEAWYRDGEIDHGQRELLVQDPDGYLLRFVEILGERPARG